MHQPWEQFATLESMFQAARISFTEKEVVNSIGIVGISVILCEGFNLGYS